MRLLISCLICLTLTGCPTAARQQADSYRALADQAAQRSLDEVNKDRVARSLPPLQLLTKGVVQNDVIDGRPAMVVFYDFDPAYPRGRFMVYVFKDNREVRIVLGE